MKKTVWVVEDGEYSDYRVEGVFSSEANARAAQKFLGGDVSEWDLDPGVDQINKGRRKYNVLMLRDGSTEKVEEAKYMFDLLEKHSIWDRPNAPAYRGKNIPAALSAEVWAKNERHAIKIVNEIRSKMIATGEWK